jgi:hypothetical protein
MHIPLFARFPMGFTFIPLFLVAAGTVGMSAVAAPTVSVGARSNCPGPYLPAGNGKLCQSAPDYKDIIFLGENSKKSCPYPYTRVNAGDSKWCVTYPDL